MANNTDSPFGLKPVRYLNGSPWNGQTNMYLIPSTDGTPTFIGDPVAIAGGAGAAGTVVNGVDVEGMPTIKQAAAGSTPVGVVVGFLPFQSSYGNKLYRESSVNAIALVVDDPNVIFEVQEDSDTSTIAAAEVGENADLIGMASGSTVTGISAVELDSSSHTASSATVRILRLVPRPGNQMAAGGVTDKLYAKWEVIFNEHQYKTTTGV